MTDHEQGGLLQASPAESDSLALQEQPELPPRNAPRK